MVEVTFTSQAANCHEDYAFQAEANTEMQLRLSFSARRGMTRPQSSPEKYDNRGSERTIRFIQGRYHTARVGCKLWSVDQAIGDYLIRCRIFRPLWRLIILERYGLSTIVTIIMIGGVWGREWSARNRDEQRGTDAVRRHKLCQCQCQ